ncbi:MAG: sodium:solute symporter family protein [Planctomycetota bacterium]
MTELWIISGYLLLLLGLGLFASRFFSGSKSDYQVASHSIGPFLLLMSLFGTTMTAFALVGSSGEAFKEGVGVYGMLASSSGIIHSLCFFLIGVKVWALARRHGYTTQIQFFRDRLASDKIGLALFPILVGLVIPYLLIGVMASGTVIQGMTAGAFEGFEPFRTGSPGTSFGVPKWIGSLVVCLVVLTYVFFGGMRGTAWANALQTTVFMVLGVVTFVVIANELGDRVYQDRLAKEAIAAAEGERTFFDNLALLGGELPEARATRSEMSFTKFVTYMLIPFSVGMFPHLFQHWMTAKSAGSFKLPVVAHPVFIMIVWVPCVLVGVWATLWPTLDTLSLPPLPKLPDSEVVNANAVLTFIVKKLTSPVLGGFLAAGILAAIMSSLDSQFLSIGTMFSTDIVNHYRREPLSDRGQVLATRAFVIGVVALVYFLSLGNYTSVFALAVWCFSGFSSLFPLVFAAVYWRGLSKAGAYASVLAAAGTWAYLFAQSGYGKNRTYALELAIAGETYEVMPVAAMFLASTLALFLVSLITPKPSEATLAKFFAERD